MCGAEVASDESTFVAVCAAQGRPEEGFGHLFTFYSLSSISLSIKYILFFNMF